MPGDRERAIQIDGERPQVTVIHAEEGHPVKIQEIQLLLLIKFHQGLEAELPGGVMVFGKLAFF